MTSEKTKAPKAEKGAPQKLKWYQEQNAQAGKRRGNSTKKAGKKSVNKSA